MNIIFKSFCSQQYRHKAFTSNFYQVLGVSNNANTEDIKQAYYKMAKLYHPDADSKDDKESEKNQINPNRRKLNEEKFKEITNAYQVLSNQDSRKNYDSQIGNRNMNEGKEKYEGYYYSQNQGDYSYQRSDNNYTNYSDPSQEFYTKNRNYNSGNRFRSRYRYNYQDNYRTNEGNNNNYTQDKSSQDEDEHIESFFLYKDPYSGKYYRVKVRSSYSKNSKYPNYNENDEDFHIGIPHLVAVFSVGMLIFIYIINSNRRYKEFNRDAVIYKNTVYYPKNKDPILEDLVNKQGFSFPKEIYDVNSNRILFTYPKEKL